MGVQASFNGTDFTLMKQVLLLFQPGWGASVDTRPFNGTCFVFISVKIWKGGGSPPPPMTHSGSDGPTVLLLLTPFWLLTDVVASNATFSSSIGHVSYCSLLLSDCIFVI